MNIEDVKVGELYVKIPVSPFSGKPSHNVRCTRRTEKEVSLKVEQEGSVSNGMTWEFNQIECERYLREL